MKQLWFGATCPQATREFLRVRQADPCRQRGEVSSSVCPAQGSVGGDAGRARLAVTPLVRRRPGSERLGAVACPERRRRSSPPAPG
jgi:hypothetical protein